MARRKTKIAFGRCGNWERLVGGTIDGQSFAHDCVDIGAFDLDDFDYAVPVDLADAGRLRDRYGARHRKYLIPDAAMVALCADKKAFNEAALGSEFAWMIPPVHETARRRFPYVLKKRDGLAGKEIFAIRHLAEERPHVARLNAPDYFCQAYVPGRIEYATHMLLAAGRVVYHSTNEYEMAEEFSIKGLGLGPVREAIGVAAGAGVIAALGGFLAWLGFREGTCCFDYKMVAGRIQILEMNPRVGFSLFRDIDRYLRAYIGVLAG